MTLFPQHATVETATQVSATDLFIFLGFAHVPRGGLVRVRADVHLLGVSIELTLQRLLVFLASRTMAAGLNVECDPNTGCAFGRYWNVPEPFRDSQRRLLHASQSPIAPFPLAVCKFQVCITDPTEVFFYLNKKGTKGHKGSHSG